MDRLEAARTAMKQRKDVQAEWAIKTFGSLVDGPQGWNNIAGCLAGTAPLPLLRSLQHIRSIHELKSDTG